MHLLTDEEEVERLASLSRCAVIDTAPEEAFDALAVMAAHICETQIALIGFMDGQREWFKAHVGCDLVELPLSQSLDLELLAHAEPLTVSDTLIDPRFFAHPPILGEAAIRFYANAPICSPDGFVIGAIAIADEAPHDLPPQNRRALNALADQIGALIELRRLRLLVHVSHQQALLAELASRAFGGEPLNGLMEWMTSQIAHVFAVEGCCILELLPNNQALPRAHFGGGAPPSCNSAMPLSHYVLATYTLRAGQPVVIESMANERRFSRRKALQASGFESGISLLIPGVPRPYGVIIVFSAKRRSFTSTDVLFLQAAADLLAGVIAQRSHQHDLESIVALSRILRQAATRAAMMTIIFAHIDELCQSKGAALVLRDADGHACVTHAHGVWASAVGGVIAPGSSPSWQVMKSGQPFLGDRPDFQVEPATPQVRTAACVALTFNDQPIGVLWVAYASVVSYSSQRLLIGLADVIASAIHRSNLHEQTIRLYQERQQLTKEVRRIERRLASTVESAIDLVVSTDPDGRIVTWNLAAERVSGFTRDQMVGQYLRDLCAPAHQAIMEEMIKILMAGASFGQVEIPLIGTTRQDVPISWRLSAIQSDTGECVGIVAVGRDLAEQRRLESQLFQAAKMASMGVMASGIGHELRNPLSIISANAQLAQERIPDHELIRTCLQQIHVATKRAALIIDNLLTFARPRNEGSQIVDINEILTATLMLLDYQIQQHHVQLIANLSPAIPKVAGNAALLQQVFTNLILNALQAMEGGGVLDIRTRTSQESGVEAVFSDTGSGISPEVLPQIFDPFFTTRPIGQGTGLGLAISYSIVQQHGGIIETVSQPGEGSTFSVRLPAAPV